MAQTTAPRPSAGTAGMAVHRPGHRASGPFQAAPSAVTCRPCVHLGYLCRRDLAARQSPRPDVGRPAIGQISFPLMETRTPSGAGGVRSSNNTSSSGNAVGSHTWLTPCVRNIVTTAGQRGRAPTLHLVFSSRDVNGNLQHHFETVPVLPAVADNPQRWTEFATHVRNSGANGLVLVRPIASPEHHCVYAATGTQAQAASQPAPDACTTTETPAMDATCASCATAAAAACSPVAGCPPAAASEVVEGQVGTCCEPGEVTAPVPRAEALLSERGAGAGVLMAALRPQGPTTPQSGVDSGATQYYGLVVQGNQSSVSDGCWVLKTTRSDSVDGAGLCSCTHFSLTRVCLGQPLYTQLRDAWLVQ